MKYTFEERDQVHILTVDNLLLDYENKLLLREVEDLIEEGARYFVIDLGLLDYINSVGLSFLIAVLTKSRNTGGETVIVNVSTKIDALLTMTKLQSIFAVGDSVAAGIALLQAASTSS